MTPDTLADLGPAFLGSRLKRLSDRLQAEATAVLQAHDLPIQPAQQVLLAALKQDGALTIGALAQRLRLSQPTITRTVQGLVDQGLVAVSRGARDLRHKTLSLTEDGARVIGAAQREIWPRVAAAVTELCDGGEQALLDQISALEARLDAKSLVDRVTAARGLTVREFSDDLAGAFYAINAAWISQMFTLEENDVTLLENPRALIVDKGGAVLFAQTPDLGVVGTCAIMRMKDGWFELTKMGVLEAARGRKVGEFLLAAALERAEAMGVADRLYLLTNRKCAAAIHLYEKLGFQHDAEIMALFGGRYERCDVAMRYWPAS
ncbi:bifunctional helix-turn-helix transcriptional regulator/GNAT family N-acetyltransferase [Caulobacter rhizosphaerae]|jgi:DNA-binding MarR family transcriptional regulator/GNAT superfamily N-acetyltransferase|uniref:bifunctional helix-turn-helix transcriptional regulator/GNAT family N-acetyltransferase n=1 Tax=Caulobacter rhizosphaerae TaxID=2010972 RepID=UPI0013D6D9B6|nr:bifunctional helix-turn-helix transcriptional regulator/GNAT family N-acetyltransferase [Caulobacter rhizosphaerae]GGL21461.1 MarR family transcriptional regulator [Caulobacter rhizosphaerae]